MRVLKGVDVKNKRVLVRVDFNVPIENGRVLDDFRIRATIPTLNYLKERGAKTIIAAHLGRPERGDPALSMIQTRSRLETLLKEPVEFVEECVGEKASRAATHLGRGEFLLLENLRFHPEEEKNDEGFAKLLALLADIYVNDAFGVSHRAHASVEAVTKFLPSFAGLLLEKEVKSLEYVLRETRHPLVLIMGGAKVSTKLHLISSFLSRAEHIILGGVIANTVLAAKGLSIGKSKFEENIGRDLEKIDLTNTRLHLPLDLVVSRDMTGRSPLETIAPGSVKEEDIILDIGPESVEEFSKIIYAAEMIIWNGPMGLVEVEVFARGTKQLAGAFGKSDAYKVVGGGDVIGVLEKTGILDTIDYVSTGGGAMLEFLAGDILPGLRALENQEETKRLN